MNRLFLIDLSNFLHKYANTLNLSTRLDNGVEVNTSAIYGLMKTLAHSQFEDIVIALDGQPKLFEQYYPEYKGHRGNEFDGKVRIPFQEIIEFINAYEPFAGKRIHIAASPGCEADQVISSIVHGLQNKRLQMFKSSQDFTTDYSLKKFDGWSKSNLKLAEDYAEIVIGTTDSDMYQLLEYDNVFISTRTNGTDYYSKETPSAVAFCPPHQIPVYKALVGDVSDNIPCTIKSKSKKNIDLIKDALQDLDDLNKFISYIETGYGCLPGFKEIQGILEDFEQLKINQKISTLSFYSWPVSIRHKAPNLNVLLDKYKIKLR